MKKLVLILSVMMFLAVGATAKPANPKPMKVTLPDGSTITIRHFGDEFFSWTETLDGYNVVKGEDGFLYYDTPTLAVKVRARDAAYRGTADSKALSLTRRGVPAEARSIRQNISVSRLGTPEAVEELKRARQVVEVNGEKYRSLVVLVNFSDKQFVIPNPQQAISNLLNQDGYSVNGGTGSAWNYFYDNSNGKFDPQYDVIGPYNLSQTVSYYGANTYGYIDYNVDRFMPDVVAAVGNSIDWSQYVSSGNVVRPIFIFYAGYNEAEGGGYYNTNTIWPHQWDAITARTASGYIVNSYACSSELLGVSGTTMDGISTFCHEFGHAIGLPDFYDTDYENNGSALTPGEFSLMDSGPFNNNGRTPPSMMAMEREILGWLDNIDTLIYSNTYILPHVSENRGYKVMSNKTGEYFWVETRGSTNKWDKYAFSGTWGGMLVMRTDRTSSYLSRWNGNSVNDYYTHPCFMPVRANNTGAGTSAANASTGWLFGNSVTSLSSSSHASYRPWGGGTIDGSFTNINYSSGVTTFTFTSSQSSEDPESISFNPASVSIYIDQQTILSPVILPANATTTLTWTTSNPNVVSVDDLGRIIGVGAGVATITATTANNLTASCTIDVLNPIGDIAKSVLQNDAVFSWEYEGDVSFKVELNREGYNAIKFTTSEPFIYLPNLSANTNYEIKIYLVDARGERIGTFEKIEQFQTEAKTSDFAAMGLMKGTFTASEDIPLRAVNLPANVKSIKWYIDGEGVEAPKATLSVGNHKIELIVTTDNNVTETIRRYITISE